MNRLGQYFFTGTTFALDQYGGAFALGGPVCHLQYFAHCGALRYNTPEVVAAFGGLYGVVYTHSKRKHFGRTLQRTDHVSNVKGLDEVVIRAKLHGLDRTIDHVVCAHH